MCKQHIYLHYLLNKYMKSMQTSGYLFPCIKSTYMTVPVVADRGCFRCILSWFKRSPCVIRPACCKRNALHILWHVGRVIYKSPFYMPSRQLQIVGYFGKAQPQICYTIFRKELRPENYSLSHKLLVNQTC